MINRIKIALFAFILTGALGLCTGFEHEQNLDGAIRVWDEFVGALRIGDMPDAYSKLSEESKNILSYRDFCVEWHPIGIKYNTVLSNPGYSNFSVYGDIATIKIGLDPSLNNTEGNFIRIILEKEGGKWSLVSEKAHEQAISRASITGVLKDIIKESKVLNTAFKTGKGDFEDIVKELPRIFSSDRGRLALVNYNFELDLLRDGVLRAIPRKKSLPVIKFLKKAYLALLPPLLEISLQPKSWRQNAKKKKNQIKSFPKKSKSKKFLWQEKFQTNLNKELRK